MPDDDLWLDDIKAVFAKTDSEGLTVASARTTRTNGAPVISLEFNHPLRNGAFYVELPEDATHEQVRTDIRKAWKRFLRSHPVTRGVRTL